MKKFRKHVYKKMIEKYADVFVKRNWFISLFLHQKNNLHITESKRKQVYPAVISFAKTDFF